MKASGSGKATCCVAIPARQSAATLEHAVNSVRRQSDAEIVIAVGPSDDGTVQLAARLAAEDDAIVVLDNPTGTTPAALNFAVASSAEPHIVRVDAHAVLPAGYIEQALGALEADPRIGNVGGRQVPVGDHGFAAAVAVAMASPVGAGGAAYRTGNVAGPVDTVYLGVFRRQALEEVGGFDERMVRNQDYELNIRLREAGWIVWFDPDLEVEYTPRDSVGALARQYFDYGRYRRLTARLHPGTLRPRQLAAPALVAAVLVAGVVSLTVLPAAAPVLVVAYLLAVVLAGVAAAPRRGVQVAVALTVMHWAWGIGFLIGPPRDVSRGSGPRGE